MIQSASKLTKHLAVSWTLGRQENQKTKQNTLGDPLKMYYDPDGLIPVYPDEAFNLFIKNLMVIGLPSITGIDGFRYFTPSSMVFDEGGYKFTIYDEGSVVFVYSSSNQTN